ncbi:MAG: hypothetical protein ACOYEV_18075 [Candidatus Nanopelagicales bacterium]
MVGGESIDNERSEYAGRSDCEALLDDFRRDPNNPQTIFQLASTYESLGDLVNARTWFQQCIESGGSQEQVYYSMFKLAAVMEELGEPWSEVLDAYLRAWEYRPVRAEALSRIAFHYLTADQYELAYLFAVRAAAIPLPESDHFFVHSDVYQWRAADEQAVCASWTGRQAEAMAIWDRLLTVDGIPEVDRNRILANRDLMAAQLR